MEMEKKMDQPNQPPKRKAWYQIKIEELEAKLAELTPSPETVTTSSVETFNSVSENSANQYNDGYADGFFDCMGKYGVLSKLQRRRIHDLIKAKGPSSVKATRRTRFSVSVPSL